MVSLVGITSVFQSEYHHMYLQFQIVSSLGILRLSRASILLQAEMNAGKVGCGGVLTRKHHYINY